MYRFSVRRVTAFLNFRRFHVVNKRRRPKRGNNDDDEKPPRGAENVYYFDRNFIARRPNLSQRSRCGVDWSTANERVRETGRGPGDLSATFKGFHILEEISHAFHPVTIRRGKGSEQQK